MLLTNKKINYMKLKKQNIALAAMVAVAITAVADNHTVAPDTWVAVDGLGRTVASADAGAPVRRQKT